jgi:hypothetical protein
MSGNISSSLGGLRTLYLSYNLFAGGIPRSIGTLPELSNVILCHNRLSGSVPPFHSHSQIELKLVVVVLQDKLVRFLL